MTGQPDAQPLQCFFQEDCVLQPSPAVPVCGGAVSVLDVPVLLAPDVTGA